jgi:hypothetical protein
MKFEKSWSSLDRREYLSQKLIAAILNGRPSQGLAPHTPSLHHRTAVNSRSQHRDIVFVGENMFEQDPSNRTPETRSGQSAAFRPWQRIE